MYDEPLRPQFHFTAQAGWINDPNGLVFFDGVYHMFFQHTPFSTQGSAKWWGHAVSTDLVHWRQVEYAIKPDRLGDIWSGSAAVDWRNTTGLGADTIPPIVAMYTSAGGTAPESEGQPFTQSLAFSADGGTTWQPYAGNPVLGYIANGNRDPRILWHEPTGSWVMALYIDKNDYALFTSPNLKDWTRTCDITIPDTSECPDFFPMPLDGDAGNVKWVFWGANGCYLLGAFDGKVFTPEEGPYRLGSGPHFYAAQTWSDIPPSDGRRIQIAWMNGGEYPGMPFNQQMSFPCALSLRTTPAGVRLCQMPVREIEGLREGTSTHTDLSLASNKPTNVATGELLDIETEIEPGRAKAIVWSFRGNVVRYDAEKRMLSCGGRETPVDLPGRLLRLRILLDRTSLEVFAGEGEAAFHLCFVPDPANTRVEVAAQRGDAHVRSLAVHRLRSAW